MVREKKLALIWRHTHRDYKGVSNGVRMVLTLREGGTHSVPLTSLTEAEVEDKLRYAVSAEERRLAARYVVGRKRFAKLSEATEYANSVFRSKGIVLGIEEKESK